MINKELIEQINVKQWDPVTNSSASNENETTQTNNQTIVEKHDDKKQLLMTLYQTEKGE